MALSQHKPAPLLENQVISIAPSDSSFTIKMQVSEGDSLVLLAKNHLGPVLIDIFNVARITHSPDLYWQVHNTKGQSFEAKEGFVNPSTGVSMRVPVPITISRTKRGYKTTIEVTIPDNYSIHELTFLQQKRTELFNKLFFADQK